MRLNLLPEMLNKKKKSVRWLAEKIGMTNANLYRRINANDMFCSDLEKICKILEIDLYTFFDDDVQKYAQYQNPDNLLREKEFEFLKEKVKLLQELVETQRQTIKMLESEIKKLHENKTNT